ncbi:unnamed protein product, partial [Polarella glacialis]
MAVTTICDAELVEEQGATHHAPPGLQQLSLSGLNLTEVSVSHFTSLTELDLSHNRLKCLAGQLLPLTRLEVLNLHNNKLHSMAGELDGLEKLHTLVLSGNDLKTLRDTFLFCELPALRHLDLRGAAKNNRVRPGHMPWQ